MLTFIDYYNNEVKLSFQDHPFSKCPKHVWVICNYQDKWLLTKHKERGYEFPGGKVEEGETPEQAAIREVKEETGGLVDCIYYVGQYYVNGKTGKTIKNIYYAHIKRLVKQKTYFETDGPLLLERIPKDVRYNRRFSFIMKDDVLPKSLEYIKKKFNDGVNHLSS